MIDLILKHYDIVMHHLELGREETYEHYKTNLVSDDFENWSLDGDTLNAVMVLDVLLERIPKFKNPDCTLSLSKKEAEILFDALNFRVECLQDDCEFDNLPPEQIAQNQIAIEALSSVTEALEAFYRN